MSRLLLALTILAATAQTAGATTLGRTVLAGGDPEHRATYQHWIDSGRAPQANVTVTLAEQSCPGEPADSSIPCVDISDGKHWTLYSVPAWTTPENAHIGPLQTLHEIGHIYDFAYPQDRHRTAFLRINDMAGWLDPLNTTWEKFAMGYAYCAAGLNWAQYRLELPADDSFASRNSTPNGGFWGYGYSVGKRAYTRTCNMLAARR